MAPARVNEAVEFLPGFTSFKGTKPGTILSSQEYRLTFFGVLLNGEQSAIISRGFECCYDWTAVMNIIIDALKDFEHSGVSEELAMEQLRSWFKTFSAWGLLSTLLPRKQHDYFNECLRQIKEKWPLGKQYSEEACWTLFIEDLDLEAVIPEFDILIYEGDFGVESKRKKWIELQLVSNWSLSIKFTAEKKKCDRTTLVQTAASAVASQLGDLEDVNMLQIPITLKSPVTKRIRDLKWMSSCDELEENFNCTF